MGLGSWRLTTFFVTRFVALDDVFS